MRRIIEHIAKLAKWRILLAFLSLCASAVFGLKLVEYIQTGSVSFNSAKHGLEFNGIAAAVMTGAMFAAAILCAAYYLRSGGSDGN